MSGRYVDRFERRGAEWRIAHRVAISDWWSLVPRNHLPVPDGMEDKLIRGRQDRSDPYFEMRAKVFAR